MDKDKILEEIFEDDPLGLLNVKPKSSNAKTADERLLSSFKEINEFVEKHKREPEPNPSNISEYQLYSRLKSIREDENKSMALESEDKYNILPKEKKEINSIDDIFEDDSLDILGGDNEGLYEFKHTPKPDERASADFVAKRKPCKNFEEYEPLFHAVQADLSIGKRKLITFKQDNLRPEDFYVHNGVLLYLEHVYFEEEVQEYKSGKRVRKDGRTRCIFENGTESNMLYRSLYKALLANGRAVSKNFDKVTENFIENFSDITDTDKEAGYIYVLKSKCKDERITSIKHLYKIGYSKSDIAARIRNAEKEPTFLMAPVEYVSGWKCYNMNPQKFEQLLHNFFGESCLNIDVFDEDGKRYTPREWFIAPLEVIEQAIALIITEEIVGYRYDAGNNVIVSK